MTAAFLCLLLFCDLLQKLDISRVPIKTRTLEFIGKIQEFYIIPFKCVIPILSYWSVHI